MLDRKKKEGQRRTVLVFALYHKCQRNAKARRAWEKGKEHREPAAIDHHRPKNGRNRKGKNARTCIHAA